MQELENNDDRILLKPLQKTGYKPVLMAPTGRAEGDVDLCQNQSSYHSQKNLFCAARQARRIQFKFRKTSLKKLYLSSMKPQ